MMMKKIREMVIMLLIGVLVISLAGCGQAATTAENNTENKVKNQAENTEGSIKFTDFAGREVELKQDANRIVDLTQMDGTRAIIQLGAQNRLVGMADFGYKVFEPEGIYKDMYRIEPKAAPELKGVANVGTLNEPNIQMIISLKPDIILTKLNGKEFADTLQKQTNIPVACIGGYGEFNYDLYTIVGKLVGKEERAAELIAYTQSKLKVVTDITSAIPAQEKETVFYWSSAQINDDPGTLGRYEAFDLAGAKNVSANLDIPMSNYKTKKEQIVAWNPDFIFKGTFFVDKEKEGWHTIESIKQDPVIKVTKAVKNNQVYPTKGTMCGWDLATEVTEVFYIAKLLYPDKFTGLDVEKHGNEILKEFYGIDGLYTDMSNRLQLYEWE